MNKSKCILYCRYQTPTQLLNQNGKRKYQLQLGDHGYTQPLLPDERVPCGFPMCRKTFAIDGIIRDRHRKNCPYKTIQYQETCITPAENSNIPSLCDSKYNYVCGLLRKGLLDFNRHDAMKKGDGERLVAMWKNDFPIMRIKNHTNYSILCFRLIADIKAIQSQRMAHSIIHNRCINIHGGNNHNIAGDLAVEFLNKEIKEIFNRRLESHRKNWKINKTNERHRKNF